MFVLASGEWHFENVKEQRRNHTTLAAYTWRVKLLTCRLHDLHGDGNLQISAIYC